MAKIFLALVIGLLVALGIFWSSKAGAPAHVSFTVNTMDHISLKPMPKPLPYQFPGGGRTVFPHYRLVGLYGTPGEPVLGALGQQSLRDSITRVKKLAADYQNYSKAEVLPTFEIIATVAAASPTENGDYSREQDASQLQPWITAARENGIYVVLDLQPGRSDFLTQAKEYESLLSQPNVGLALDPEWRLGPNQVPLVQIGTVGIDEVNATAKWLSDLTAKNKLPQKLFLLHEFRLSMIPQRSKLDTSYQNLAYAVQMDGQGTQAEKLDTWQSVIANPPKNVHFGWKNFYQKDSPMRSVKDTMALNPQPWYISYQ